MPDVLTSAIDCERQCSIPEGAQLKEMPPTRHAWSDIVHCPNVDCGRFFMVVERGTNEAADV